MQPVIRCLLATVALALTSASLFGWGATMRRLAGARGGRWPVTLGIGLATVIAIGGVANLARLALPATVVGVALAGLVLGGCELRWPRATPAAGDRHAPARWTASTWLEATAVSALVVVVVGFTIATQTPPDVFNHFDDLGKYFAHPVRQLETGTVYGSPLNALGSETLGGMAFLHSFVLAVLPIQFIHGVDGVCGLFLLLCLGAAAGWRRLAPLPGGLFAPLLIAGIEPQCINVSALYVGAALMATAVLLVADEREADPPSALLLGVVYAGLVALKSTFAVFVGLHLALTVAAIAAEAPGRGVRWGLRTGAAAAAALLPWIVLHAPHYLAAGPAAAPVPPGHSETLHLFAVRPLFHGATMAHYTALAGLAALAGIRGLVAAGESPREDDLRRSGGVVVGAFTAVLAYGLLLVVLRPAIATIDTVVRYTIPILLGTVPVVVVLAADRGAARPARFATGVLLAGLLAITAAFAPALRDRYRQAVQLRSMLAFPSQRNPVYRAYLRDVFTAATAEKVARLQSLIPPGEPFVAWIGLPHLLDYRRNPVLDVDPAGLANHWARLPPAVRYVIWERDGFAMPPRQDYVAMAEATGRYVRRIGVRTLAFADLLDARIRDGETLHDADGLVVVRLADP